MVTFPSDTDCTDSLNAGIKHDLITCEVEKDTKSWVCKTSQ